MGRPVMQHRGIEICAIRPDKGRHFRVYADLLKDHQVSERSVQVSGENRAKINRLLGVIGKADTQRVRGQFLKRCDLVDRVMLAVCPLNLVVFPAMGDSLKRQQERIMFDRQEHSL